MGTIVQEYGPFYGEAVNGTVQGRPNGSVYVPYTNTITLTSAATQISWSVSAVFANRPITIAAEAQDLASNFTLETYSDSALTSLVGSLTFPAGLFNNTRSGIFNVASDPLTSGNTYYVVARLKNNGTDIAISNVLQLVAA